MAQSVADILGCPLDYATSLLEAAGGNADMAIELGLSGGMMMEDTAPAPAGATNPYPHWDAIWPAPAPLPESWQEQRLDDFVTDDDDLKLIQPCNGPCGVLAVLQAELWLQQPSAANIDKEARLNAAITAILSRINATTIAFADDTTAPKPDEAAKQIRTAAALVETAATTAGRTSGNPLPSGPKTTSFQLSGDLSTAKQAPDAHVETFKKKRVGQPDDIVQAKKTDSDNFKEWTFEVVPAIDDPDVQGEWDDDPNEPVYKFGELPAPTGPWRCASCYANRFKTMNFGTNKAGTEACEVCHTPRVQAMWSLWQSYTDLSPRMKRRARNMYASKMECVISTLYPKAEIVETTTTGSK
eukprot:scaffold2256_cov166-Amphora_coffeaeformis.AAC.5